jgi:NADH:ubiquinone oxidoreductase subunit 4 (subunit M)
MILEEFSAWFVWVIPLIASLFVPVIAKYSEKARNYFVIAIMGVVAALALTLVPGIWSGEGEAVYYTFNWLPSLNGSTTGITAGVYIDPLSILFTGCILRCNHRRLLAGLHERRRRLNTLLLSLVAFHRLHDWISNFR